MTKLATILFWAALLFAFVMAVLPQPPQLPGTPSDKLQHLVAFAVLAGLGAFAFPHGLLRLLLWLAAFGAVIEVVQAVPQLHRDADLRDWLADVAAAGAVLLTIHVLRKVLRRT